MTSARIEVDVLHLTDEGVRVMATASKCPRCDA